MGTRPGTPQTADQVRALNARLDRELLDLMRSAPQDRLTVDPGEGEWTLAENLAHIAEFPGYFARQLRAWLDGDRTVIGRVAEADADRDDALMRARGRSRDELIEEARASFAALAAVFEDLRDEHLAATTHNVKYGQEPLTVFLDRYLVGHKAAHAGQLRETLAKV